MTTRPKVTVFQKGHDVADVIASADTVGVEKNKKHYYPFSFLVKTLFLGGNLLDGNFPKCGKTPQLFLK